MPISQPNDPLRGFRGYQQQFDQETRFLLGQVSRDIRARIRRLPDNFSGNIRKRQLELVLNEIHNVNNEFWNRNLLNHIQVGRGTSAEIAQRALDTLNRFLTSSLPPDLSSAVRDSLRATARAGIETMRARVPRPLSDRVWNNSQLANGRIDRLIRSGLAQGLSARELADTVFQFINPLTRGGQSYAAMRLARTEINNAFHQQQIEGGREIGVQGVLWNLSDSHPEPDLCDEYAAHEEGSGKGVWKVDEVPDKPHPHCFCYLSYVTFTPDEFAEAMLRGDFDAEIDRELRSMLDGYRS